MEKQLNRVSMLSLQEITLRTVVVLLWNTPRCLFSIRNLHFGSSMPCDHPRNWRESVSSEVRKLHLPELIEKQMIWITRPIGLQIVRWKLYHEAYLNAPEKFFDVPILQKLQWTAAGTIDYRKTAEELVLCDVLDFVKRYKLACLYCLDHYIPDIWQKLPEAYRRNFYVEEASHITAPLLRYFWPNFHKGYSNVFDQFLFEFSSSQGNEAAAKYFLQKLSPDEREASLMSAVNFALESQSRNINTYPSSFPNAKVSDVVFYLLSEMTPEQQVQIFKARPADVLACFLDWPWQDAFFDFSDAMWSWMQSEDLECRARNYDFLLHRMQRSIQKSDYYLPNLFQNFFMSSPSDFRIHFVDRECSFRTSFTELFNIQDTETIRVVLSNLDAGDKLRIAFSKPILHLFYYSISRGRGHVVEMFLREVGLSKEDNMRLEEDLKKILKRTECGAIESETPKWKRIFEFLESSG